MKNKKKKTVIRFDGIAKWKYLTKGALTVTTFGFPDEFQLAFLNILSTTISYYKRVFGRNSIARVEFNARKARGLPHRLWTNGADRIYLTISRKSQLAPPAKSRVRNVHGLTHELAHIVLYRSLVNLRLLKPGWGEGWAIYAASFLAVPHLYKVLGSSAWPYPHDFLYTDGPSRYIHVWKRQSWKSMDPRLSFVRQLFLLEQELGRRKFQSFFREQFRQPVYCHLFVKKLEQLFKQVGIPIVTPKH